MSGTLKATSLRMILLLVAFFLIGAVMVALVAFELPPDTEPVVRPRRQHHPKKISRRSTRHVEHRAHREVETGHTATGSAHGK